MTIIECRRCHLAKTEPAEFVTTSDYAGNPQLGENYAGVEDKSFEYSQKIIDVVVRHMPRGKLLDVGCSVGALVQVADRAGFEAEGIDLDPTAVRIGQSRQRRLATASLSDWPTSDYSVLTLQHTLEHLSDPVAFLVECRRHLKPGGCIAIVVPCHDGLHPRILGKRWYGWQTAQHYFHYSQKSLRAVLAKAGFDVAEIFQESMDHRLDADYLRKASVKEAMKLRAMFQLAMLGERLGRGDQLVAIGMLAGDTAS